MILLGFTEWCFSENRQKTKYKMIKTCRLISMGLMSCCKKTNEYGLKVYKYEKTEELFKALAEYYK